MLYVLILYSFYTYIIINVLLYINTHYIEDIIHIFIDINIWDI